MDTDIWISADDGTRLALLDRVSTFDYVTALNDVGRFNLTLPGSVDPLLIARDRRLSFWRRPERGKRDQDFQGVLTWWEYSADDAGAAILKLAGPGLNQLLKRRIVPSAAGSAGASKTAAADNLIKAIVRENLGASASAARMLTALSVEPDLTLAPSLTRDFAYRKVFDVLRDVADASTQAGTPLFFEITASTETALLFRTAINQLGADRRTSSLSPIVFALEFGNLKSPKLSLSYDDEANYIYAGGQGEGAGRVIKTAQDTTRSGLSCFALSEGFIDARNTSTDASTQSEANAALTAGRPKLKFTAEIVDGPAARYGVDWRCGDRVTACFAGQQFACLIRSVRVSGGADGKETIAAALEATL